MKLEEILSVIVIPVITILVLASGHIAAKYTSLDYEICGLMPGILLAAIAVGESLFTKIRTGKVSLILTTFVVVMVGLFGIFTLTGDPEYMSEFEKAAQGTYIFSTVTPFFIWLIAGMIIMERKEENQ